MQDVTTGLALTWAHKNNYPAPSIMFKTISRRSWLIPLLTSVYLKWLLLPTANLLFELYHLLNLDVIYHLYSGFKILSYFFNSWPWQDLSIAILALMLFILLQRRAHKRSLALQGDNHEPS